MVRGAKVIVTVGWLMTNATVAAAKLYPRVQFIGIDQVPARPLPRNYQGLDFDRAEAGYLAGIVAGWTTKTDKVGVVGGIAKRGGARVHQRVPQRRGVGQGDDHGPGAVHGQLRARRTWARRPRRR